MQILQSSVVAVTVYRRGALVTREVAIDGGEDGFPQHVQLVGLPLTLEDGSLRAEVTVDGGEAPIAGDIRVTVAVPTPDDRIPPALDDVLAAAKLRHATAVATLENLREAVQRLQWLALTPRGQASEGETPRASPTAARLQLLQLRHERATQLQASIADALDTTREAEQALETLQLRKRAASGHINARAFELRKAAVVRLQSTGANEASTAIVRLRYFVTGARWAPAYTVRLDDTMQAGTLQLRAMVGQETGEDWGDVALTLSTANPQHWTELPELKAIRIGRAQPAPARTGWRPPPVGADALYADYDRELPSLGSPPPPAKSAAEPSDGFGDPSATGAFPMDDLREEPAPMPPMPQGMPMPPPSAAPMPSAPMPNAMMPESQARSPAMKRSAGVVAGLLGGAATGAVAAAQAVASFGGGGDATPFIDEGDDDASGSMDAGLVAGRDLLDYGGLELRAGGHAHRGKLVRVETRARYQRWAVEQFDVSIVSQRLESAQRNARAFEGKEPPADHQWVADDTGFDYAYVAADTTHIPSNGQLVSLAVASHAAEVSPRYVAVPRETQDVFRIVAVRNPLQAPLLPGPADVYVGGSYALTSQLATTPPRGRLELGLGVEQGIKIARNVDFEEDTSGLLKRSHELVHTIRVDLTNNLSRTAMVEVRERVPVTVEDSDEVEVETRDVEPPWEEFEPRDPTSGHGSLEGGRVWKVELPAKSERKLRATWLARVPSQHELVGGNRRER